MRLIWCILILLGVTLTAYTTSGELKLDGEVEEADLIENLMQHKEELRNFFMGTTGPIHPNASPVTCSLCRTLITLVLFWFSMGQTLEQMTQNAIELCVSTEIVTPDICEMIAPLYADPLYYILTHRPWLRTNDFCGILLGGSLDGVCSLMNPNMTDWETTIAGDKPPLVSTPLIPGEVPSVKVIHITDIHPDIHYAEGSLSVCDKPLCCRPDPNDDPTNASIAAGPWGDFYCDFPIDSMRESFVDAATRHPDADFVIMTGDLVHHQVWNTTVEDNLAHYLAFGRAMLEDAFPNTIVYPAIGNHEPHPCNMFPTSDVWNDGYDISWVYTFQANLFQKFLTPEAYATYRRAGYYTLLHKPGFRIISINSNFCYTNNFWLLYNTADPEGQLEWLSEVLDQAEAAGERVWIIGHVPPGSDDCWHIWSDQFHKLVNRYEAIIMAQFYGHTHNDDMRIFFDYTEDPPRPTGSIYIGASITPYTDLNPGYKVFYTDGARNESTWEILDHETYVYNLTQANTAGLSVPPVWYKEYSAKEAYGLASFRPADLYDFVVRMVTDDSLFKKFLRYWYKDSGRENLTAECDEECKFEYLCDIVRTDYTSGNCNRLRALVNSTTTSAE